MNNPSEGISILLIENDAEKRDVFLNVLQKSELYIKEINVATSYTEAAQYLDQTQTNIIFTAILPGADINQPFIDKLKEISILIPLITISGEMEERYRERSLSIGADDHLFRNEISEAVLRKTIQYSIERKKSNEELREAIERYHLVAKATNDIAWDWDLNKRCAFWVGNGIKHILKYDETEKLVDTNFWESQLHPDDRERVIHKLKVIFEEAKVDKWEDEYQFRNKEGSYNYIYDRGFIVYRNGIPVRMLGIMEDITAKVMLEKKLDNEKTLKQQQITEAVITAQEKERTEIGKELHDNVNQLLSASRLYIDAAGTDSKNTAFLLSQASSFIKNAIEEIRTLSKVLHSPLISEWGLAESINNLAEEISAVNEIEIDVDMADLQEDVLNENFKLTLYRMVQEQLTNILKHAKASEAYIGIKSDQYYITLQIKDNGIGFDTEKKRKGIGISNIFSRANMYNGKVQLRSSPGNGSSLTVQFSIKEVSIHNEYFNVNNSID